MKTNKMNYKKALNLCKKNTKMTLKKEMKSILKF